MLSAERSWVALPAAPTLQRETWREPGESAGQSQVPGGGGRRRNLGGGVTERLHPEENNACLPESKRQHTQTQMPAGSGSRRARKREWAGGAGGASPVWPGGSVADCQGPGGHPGAARIAPKEPRFRRGGGGRKRGICSSWEGGPRRKKEEKEEID